MSDPVVILSYARTPMGSFQGSLAGASATELGAAAVRAAVERAGVDPDDVERCYMGCVLPAGLGQAPARQAALGAGLPKSTEAVTINKMCGSGMKAAMMAADAIAAGSSDVIVAGGMESMSNAPYLMKKHRAGARIGHDTVYDHMMLDGLEDAYEPGRAMGTFAEATACDYQLTRQQQDDYAIASLTRAQAAQNNGWFDREITAVEVKTRRGSETVDRDEQPLKGDPSKIPTLRPGHTAHAREPALFTTAPVGAIQKLLAQTGWSVGDVDLFEINEAFACVTMFAMQDLGIAHEKVNIHGGATAMGHPIGASGARILATLISALERTGGKRGIAALCIGGGEATAMAVELVD